jgi:hypothetical protein
LDTTAILSYAAHLGADPVAGKPETATVTRWTRTAHAMRRGTSVQPVKEIDVLRSSGRLVRIV